MAEVEKAVKLTAEAEAEAEVPVRFAIEEAADVGERVLDDKEAEVGVVVGEETIVGALPSSKARFSSIILPLKTEKRNTILFVSLEITQRRGVGGGRVASPSIKDRLTFAQTIRRKTGFENANEIRVLLAARFAPRQYGTSEMLCAAYLPTRKSIRYF